VIAELTHREVDASAGTGVRNSQPEGIGRVVTLGDLVCWNNLGRNVVFADLELRPYAVFGTTLFPDDDEPSQYDLDVHAILDVPELGLVVVTNHFGTVRGFRRADIVASTGGRLIEPSSVWSFVADVERTVVVAGRLVGSAPRSDGAVGLLVSEPLSTLPDHGTIPTRSCSTDFGEVTALGLVPSPAGPLIAIGGDRKVALVPVTGSPTWEKDVPFRVAALVSHGHSLWAAGPDSGGVVDDYDWERLRGGGFALLDPVDGQTVASGLLPEDVAWGTGGVAVVPFGPLLAAAGRTGRLHLVDPRGAADRWSTSPVADGSLGIAHMAASPDRRVCGFNRGGYRLHLFTQGLHSEDRRA
jgi:hypothetical protein